MGLGNDRLVNEKPLFGDQRYPGIDGSHGCSIRGFNPARHRKGFEDVEGLEFFYRVRT